MGNDFYNNIDLENFSSNDTSEQNVNTETNKSNISAESGKKNGKLSFARNAKNTGFDFLKNGDNFKIDKYQIGIGVGYVLVIIFIYYFYSNNMYYKLTNLPTKKENIAILNNNISKQDKEMKALDNLKINDSELKNQEKILSDNLPEENNFTAANQFYKINQIAKSVGLEIDGTTLIEELYDEEKVNKIGDIMRDIGINNIYTSLWYKKFIITAKTDEETLRLFQQKIDDSVGFMFDGWSVSKNQGEISYSVTIKAFYSLSGTENE